MNTRTTTIRQAKARTDLSVAPEVDVRLERRQRGDKVRDVVDLRRLECAVTRVPRCAGVRWRRGLIGLDGGEARFGFPLVPL